MHATIVVMPGSPALVPELAPRDEPARRLVAGVRALVTADRPLDLVGSRDRRWYTARTGSLGAWGAPLVRRDVGNYLPELVQRSIVDVPVRAVRGSLQRPDPEALTLLALDGSAGLTARAPLALLDGAAEADAWCRALLSGEAPEPWSSEDLRAAGVLEPELWLELAGFPVVDAELLDVDTTTGVGRYLARLTVEVA